MSMPKCEVALICDDIRREDTGKLIAIGLYGADARFTSFPTDFNFKLLAGLRAETPQELRFQARAKAGRKQLSAGRGKLVFGETGYALMAIGPIICHFEQPTTLSVQLKLGDGRFRTVAQLPIVLATNPSSGV